MQQFANAARATLAAAISDTDTALTLAAGAGALFPPADADNWWYLTLDDGAGIEIVQVTAGAGDTLSVVRGQQGTPARAFAAGAIAGQRITAADAAAWAGAAGQLSAMSGALITRARVLSAPVYYTVLPEDAGTAFLQTASSSSVLTLPALASVPLLTAFGAYAIGLGSTVTFKTVTGDFVRTPGDVGGGTGALAVPFSGYAVVAAGPNGWLPLYGSPAIWSAALRASPALTGTPTAPTPAAGNNSTQIATTAWVQAAISAALASLGGTH